MMNVGVCGFCKSQKEIFSQMKLLEVQKTFYNPPLEKTAKRWRRKAPSDFEFTVKAWQVITHPASSPTYRKVTTTLGKKEHYGFFQPEKEVFAAFEKTVSIARLLKSRIIVFQTPAMFKPRNKNIRNMKEFFQSVTKKFTYVWESRGLWNPDTLKEICTELNLIDGTDPFKRLPVTEPVYFRLHGSPPAKRMYTYTYTGKDLEHLYSLCKSNTYVLFNNITMFQDALRFKLLLSKK